MDITMEEKGQIITALRDRKFYVPAGGVPFNGKIHEVIWPNMRVEKMSWERMYDVATEPWEG